MHYEHICPGRFLTRLNRFVAIAEICGERHSVHVKNTGRCRELLVPGAEIWLAPSDNPARKTSYDLICVRKDSGILFNIDSQAPNRVVREWLEPQGFEHIQPEYRFGQSRIDFYLERKRERHLLEVKGCTLERDGIGYFPDAPTERGTKHLRELTAAVSQGYSASIAFVLQADELKTVLPNKETDPVFAAALEEAVQAGVSVLFLPCHVEPNRLEIVASLRL